MFAFTQRLWFKNALLLAGFAYLIFQCGFCAFNADAPLFIHLIGWAGLVFFGGGGAYILYRNFVLRTHGLRLVSIGDEGLILNGELIPWDVIEGFETMKLNPLLNNHQFLIRTSNCEEVIASTRNPLKRWSRRRSLKNYGAIYTLDEDYVDGSIEAFIALCEEHIQQNKRKQERLAY